MIRLFELIDTLPFELLPLRGAKKALTYNFMVARI